MRTEFRPFVTGSPDTDAIRAFLAHQEAANNILLRMFDLVVNGVSDPEKAYLIASLHAGTQLVGVLVRTPVRRILFSQIESDDLLDVVDCVASHLRAQNESLSGAFGPTAVTELFTNRWTLISGQIPQISMLFHHFELETVIAPVPTEGRLRLAVESDVDTLARYGDEFVTETGLPEEERKQTVPERVAPRVRAGELYVWEVDGNAVTTAAVAGTARVRRIGFVYTPPEYRKRGFASAFVASLSQRLLDEGAWRVSLSTDPRNPTSNRIYRAIGFKYLSDGVMYAYQ